MIPVRVLLVAFAALAPAQEPLLHVTARQARWLAAFTEALDLTLPELPAGDRYVLRVAANASPAVTTSPAPADAPLLDVEARVAAWLARGDEAVARTQRLLTNRAVGFASLAGLPKHAASDLVEGAFAVARSTEVARLSIGAGTGNRDYVVRIELVPAADSALAKWLSGLSAAPAQPPVLAWRDAMASLGINLRAESLRDVVTPFLPVAAAITGTPAKQLLERLALLDGTFGLTLAPTRLGICYGLRDAGAFVARATDAALLRQETEALARGGVTAEFTADAERHRDIPLLRSRAIGKQPLPGLADDDGALVTFGGCTGNLWLQVGGEGAQDSVKAAIDDALAGRLPAPFPAATDGSSPWLTIELDLARLALALAPATPETAAAPSDAPLRMRLSLSSSPHSLLANLELK